MDVVYNHTTASGQDPKSVLDRIVPGYYHRLSPTGAVETSTCCANTATEHRMMEKLMVDSVVTWAKEYKVDGFRFDLMGHHSKANMLAVRGGARRADAASTTASTGRASTSTAKAGTSARSPTTRGSSRRRQAQPGGTGIGTFTDRLRDAVRGGGPFDGNPRIQGFATGLVTDSNGDAGQRDGGRAAGAAAPVPGPDQGRPRRQLGGLRVRRPHGRGRDRQADVDYNGQPAGYADDPSETVTYVDAHDNETLFDVIQYKLPQAGPSMSDRVRMNTLALATTALSQGVVVLARRQRPAAVEVARPQLVRLRRLVQPGRLVGDRTRHGGAGCRSRPTTRASGSSCGRSWATRR